MESPTAPISDRKPLQSVNSQRDPNPSTQMKQKLKQASVLKIIDKENGLMDESTAVSRRKERMRLEREKTEEVMRVRERELERGVREMERREEELRRLKEEIQRLIRMKERQSSSKRSQFQSLRAKEHERRSKEA